MINLKSSVDRYSNNQHTETSGYKALFSEKQENFCIELACWAHVRRKFFDLHRANNSSMTFEALQRIGNLYAIEAESKDLVIEVRQQLRKEKSLP